MNSDLFLVQRSSQGEVRFTYRLKLGDQLIGRSIENDIHQLDETISRVHARLSVGQTGVIVTDLDSRNGTWVNRKRVACVSVFPGEEIQFGSVVMVLSRHPNGFDGGSEDEETHDARSALHDGSTEEVSLPEAQARVLELLKQGMMEKQVAEVLEKSIHTVHNQVKKIYRAYKVSTRVELLLKLLPREQTR